MTRSQLRENIFRLLYEAQFNGKEEMEEQISMYFSFTNDEEEEASPQDADYIREKYEKVFAEAEKIDAILNNTAKGWKTSRMGQVDLAILRLAVFEMKYDEDVPVGVAINEAVELAKKYGREESPAFINGILGQIARSENDQ